MKLLKTIDHTLLKPDATRDQIRNLCKEAMEYGFASVCIQPYYVPYAVELLKDSDIPVCTVVGFPHGMTSTESKVAETEIALRAGSREFDMVCQIGNIKDGRYEDVEEDILAVVKAAKGHIVKVILETCLLNDDELIRACQVAEQAGAHYVKTSTGFSTGGATVDDIRLMHDTVGKSMGVKASGGIKTLDDAVAMIRAGATRIGASAGVSIAKSLQSI